MKEDYLKQLCTELVNKGELKEKISSITSETMQLFKEATREFESFYKTHFAKDHEKVNVIFKNNNQYEFQLRFAGDVLVFMMHTDVFEFPRDHEVMRTKYIKDDPNLSYCGMIQIFNFLSDSFQYERINDVGYMIGRILINKEGHYYVEGKRELAQVLNNFTTNTIDADAVKNILYSAIKYAINFDLLLPSYDTHKEISARDVIQMEDSIITFTTAKRLGFRFEPDAKLKE